MQDNKCVICGDIIPEGLQVCPSCQSGYIDKNNITLAEAVNIIDPLFLNLHAGRANGKSQRTYNILTAWAKIRCTLDMLLQPVKNNAEREDKNKGK